MLPPIPTELPCLNELDISLNCIRELGADFSRFPNLEKLNLFRNRLDSLPVEMLISLKQLQEITLEWFEFADPPLPRKFT